MAYGVFFSGTGLFGAFIPAILEWGLYNYGFRLTLQVWALVVVRLGFSLSPLVLYPPFPLSLHPTPRFLTCYETGHTSLFPCLLP